MTELLTTSRVHRLLRPLRNKCNSLAALPSSATASRLTYSKQSSNWDPRCRPPLIVLCPPAGAKRLTLDKHSADEFELSRRIHAVCDAFKNIAHVAYGQPSHQRIPSLAAMCTLVIGGNMPVTNTDDALLDFGQDSTDDNVPLDVDGIYEAVPPHYRRFLIVSHALFMIFSICIHHHTLVTILLDHCLSFGLAHESTHLLNMILAQAFLPSDPSYPPPATHPAHTNYLFDLHAKWSAGNKPSGTPSGASLFTTSAFCRAVLSTLSQSSSHSLWTSKVLNRFIESCDLDSYIVITHTLSLSFWNSSHGAIRDDVQSVTLKDKLSELMSNLFDLLFTHDNPHSSPQTSSRIYAVINILYECHATRLHCLRTSTPGSSVDLPDMIIVFATHIFVAFRNSIDNPDHLLAILDDSSPIPTTFSKLMVYFSWLRDSQAFGDSVEAFLAQLEMYSSVLRSEKFFGLDASLWACALHHFEISIAGSRRGHSTLVTRYKQQLMEAVDAAERRCFGADIDSSPVVSLSVGSNRTRRTKRRRLSGHWEWEDMVGSWIRKTPVLKKRKIDDGRLHSHLCQRGAITSKAASGSISPSMPLSICHRHLLTLSPTPSQPSESDGPDYQYENDKENYPNSPPPVVKRSRPFKRRKSNFFSLLADAQTNRIVLHPKPRPESKPPSSVIPEKYILPLSSQEYQHPLRKQEEKTSCRKAPPPATLGTLFLSDDSLDLFAYATSSPARY